MQDSFLNQSLGNELIGKMYNELSLFFLQLTRSEYFNLGFWDEEKMSFKEAQEKLVSCFLSFSSVRNQSVLDIGCGSGELLMLGMRDYGIKQAIGVDLSESLVLRSQTKDEAKQVKWICQNLFDVKLGSKKFDRILALESFYHFLDQKKLFKFAKKLLKLKGELCIAEPIFHTYQSLKADLIYDIENEIKNERLFSKKYLPHLLLLGHRYIEKELESISEHPAYHLTLQKRFDLFDELELNLVQKENFTDIVIPFFHSFKKVMVPFILCNKTPELQRQIMLSALVVFYFRYLAFQKGEAGYYFLKIKKTV